MSWTTAGAAMAAAVALMVPATLLAYTDSLGAGSEGRGRLKQPLQNLVARLTQPTRRLVASDRLLYQVGLNAMIVIPFLKIALIPIAGSAVVASSVGVVWFNALDIALWAAVWLVGWGTNAAFNLVGGYRYLAQALCYELPLMFALTVPAVASSSLDISVIVASQGDLWNIVWMPVAFAVFMFAVMGFAFWGPFNYPAGNDVGGGVLAELGGVDRIIMVTGRYLVLTAGMAFGVALFLGGGAGPWLPDAVWFLVKIFALLFVAHLAARRLPMLAPDRYAAGAWLIVIPLVLLQLLVVSMVVTS